MLHVPNILKIKFRPSALYLIRKTDIVHVFLFTGMFIAYIGSLHPWFIWSIGETWLILSALCLAFAYYLSCPDSKDLFSRTDCLPPFTACVILLFYQLWVNEGTINGAIGSVLRAGIFLSLFMLRRDYLFRISTRISQAMGCLLLVSMLAFACWLAGLPLPLPSCDAQYNDGEYSYTNYMLFMVDDRSMWQIIPRFSSVFLEPGHIGTATALLLFTQIGHWKRWYNVVLIIATLITFSLAAYVIFLSIIIFSQWIKGRHVMGKVLLAVLMTASIVIGSFFYRNGDNMLNNLIVLRLEINEEGDLEGDNRVKDWFESEYDSFLHSSDIWLGRNPQEGELQGNSGYRVFIYENGLIGLLLIAAFYLLAMAKAENRRVWISVMLVAAMCFYVRTHSLLFNVFIPLYAAANIPIKYFTSRAPNNLKEKEKQKQKQLPEELHPKPIL